MLKYFFTAFIYISVLLSSYNDFNTPFINVAKNQTKTIVSIVSEKTQTMQSPFNFYFSPFEGFDFHDPYEQQYQSQSLGSGVLFDSYSGYIITNNHVIEGADNIKVILNDKREFEAEIIGTDPLSDIAVIKINANNLDEVVFGNSDNMQIGEWVIAIGSPFGLHLNHTVTAGIISAVGRNDVMSRQNFENFIQHDAAINPGNSGGALFNLDGELIGINNAIATDGWSRTNAGVGFAIPINQAKRIMEDLINFGNVTGGWLGISFQELSENLVLALDLADNKGVMVTQVLNDSPAEKANLKAKDVIIKIDNQKINGTSDLRNIIFYKYPGTSIEVTIIRDGLEIEKTIILTSRPSDEELYGSYLKENANFDKLGLKVEVNENNQIIVKEVKEGTSVEKEDIESNDIITHIDDNTIKNIEDYYDALSTIQSGDIVLIGVTTVNKIMSFSQTYSRYIAIKVD